MSDDLSDEQLEEYKIAFAIFDLDSSGFCLHIFEEAAFLYLAFSKFLIFSNFMIHASLCYWFASKFISWFLTSSVKVNDSTHGHRPTAIKLIAAL